MSDFEELEKFLLARGYISAEALNESKPYFKIAHDCIYSILIWDHKLEYTDNKIVYLKDLISDGLQAIPVFALGFKKPGYLLLRGCIESLLKHIYYFDHPIEYALLPLEPKSYLTVKELFNYVRNHPKFRTFEYVDSFLDSLTNLYFELSKKLHSTNPYNLEMLESLELLRYDKNVSEYFSKALSVIVGFVNGQLIIFHGDEFRAFQQEYKTVIISTVPKRFRRALCRYY